MNDQEAFDKIVTHVMTQKTASIIQPGQPGNDGGGLPKCLYAGPNGNACAIGCMMPRDLAERCDRLFLNENIARIISGEYLGNRGPEGLRTCLEVRDLFTGVNPKMLRALQSVHDDTKERDSDALERIWARFAVLARDGALKMPADPRLAAPAAPVSGGFEFL